VELRVSSAPAPEPPRPALAALGDPAAYPLLRDLVGFATTNLEDPAHHRWEKPHYAAAARYLVETATRWGLRARIFDPIVELPGWGDLHEVARPNVIVDLDVGAAERILILSHYDVVPVPAEQLARWRTPPHVLTFRSDGKFYGRGAADDLGSGVVPSLIALKRLHENGPAARNVRLLICCDEETGGAGGIEALRAHDDKLPPNSPDRIVVGDVALIPDGDPHATAGSSGVLFLDGTFTQPVPPARVVAFGKRLVELHSLATSWKSVYASPDWPDHGAPEPVITGRATVTKFDAEAVAGARADRASVASVHAETDAANQIAQSVTVLVRGPASRLADLPARLAPLLAPPFQLAEGGSTSRATPEGMRALSVVGTSAHAGYPHRGHNPVPATLGLLERALREGLVDGDQRWIASFGIDLRLPPELPMETGREAALDYVRSWAATHEPNGRIEAPLDRGRGGYSLPVDDPSLLKMERILAAVFGSHGVFAEYGGTDASSLVGLRTPHGRPLAALVFGLMGRSSRIHEAEENLEPAGVAGVTESILRFVSEP
jgi:acetylornithine deacetylase/succinyl-diaminopimelate desuccinylase-like protein